MFAVLPSLEVLPLFVSEIGSTSAASALPFPLKTRPSYGEISRGLLTGKLAGGVLPWEIFVTDVLALPRQRTEWRVLLFIQPCPTELVLRESVHKAAYPTSPTSISKLPTRLTIGIEGHHSLMKSQLQSWLARFKVSSPPEIFFQPLSVHLMMRGLQSDALDAVLAPSPWGIHAESSGIGKRDLHFQPGKFEQQLVIVCHRDFLTAHPDAAEIILQHIQNARQHLQAPACFQQAIANMSGGENTPLDAAIFAQAATAHAFHTFLHDAHPQVSDLLVSLKHLEKLSILPQSLSANEHTAHRLLTV